MRFSFPRNFATLKIVLMDTEGFAFIQFFYLLPLIATVSGAEDFFA